jgi:O-antigen/teichoic acid export membrane protein
MNRRQVILNALTTLAQTLAGAASLFLLYRFLIRAIGLERLGIWSLVLATTSVVFLANQGFAASVVKFVAKYAAREEPEQISRLLQTSVLTIGAVIAAVALALYPISRAILTVVLPHKSLAEALAILPLALISLWLTVLQGVLQAGLAGLQKITVCNYLEFAGSISYLLLAWLLVPSHGLFGLACAQVLQTAAIVAVTWRLLRRRVPQLPLIPHRLDRPLLRELAAYGFHFQLITASQALREPVTKALLTKFGGLAFTGLYDLANRLVFTTRELLAQAGLVLVPTISHLHESKPQSITAIYRESYRLLFFLAVPSFTVVAVLSPVISRIWIGRYEPAFVEFVCLLAAAWLINVLSNPAYAAALGTGRLRWVSLGCITTAILNAGLGFAAGAHFGGRAVVLANAVSLAAGYLIVLAAHHLENRVPFAQLLPRESSGVFGASLAAVLLAISYFAFALPALHAPISGAVVAVATSSLLVAIFLTMWFHPMRARLIRWALMRVPE